jgi:hypothetical protein
MFHAEQQKEAHHYNRLRGPSEGPATNAYIQSSHGEDHEQSPRVSKHLHVVIPRCRQRQRGRGRGPDPK